MKNRISIFWFRRDLRLEDNIGLSHALRGEANVLPIFIFDTDILDKLDNKYDRRVDYIHQALTNLQTTLNKNGCSLATFYGTPKDIFIRLLEQYELDTVYTNRDYEPNAIKRDKEIFELLGSNNIQFKGYKDQVIFDKNNITKDDGSPYTVFTPYAKKWIKALEPKHYEEAVVDFGNFYRTDDPHILTLNEIDFQKTDMQFKLPKLDAGIIDQYKLYRDFPALPNTTQLGTALRFGTISIRKCVAFALQHSKTWLSELIWREFFMQILYHFPHVVNQSFKNQYDLIKWRNNEEEFKAWCAGKTGYPLVDAGMRELNATGFMHNRVRMVTASFLCKHLLIDWRWGETYFASRLNDYDLSANNGNWQWAAGCGCDAAPYFRIFNPTAQAQRFDKENEYIKKWLPEWGTHEYPKPIVNHEDARERALSTYKNALNNT